MPDIEFEDPPAGRDKSDRLKHEAVAAKLRERPRSWAVVARKANSRQAANAAYSIGHAANLKAYEPAGSFEAMARAVDVRAQDGSRTREYRVLARYLGDVKADE